MLSCIQRCHSTYAKRLHNSNHHHSLFRADKSPLLPGGCLHRGHGGAGSDPTLYLMLHLPLLRAPPGQGPGSRATGEQELSGGHGPSSPLPLREAVQQAERPSPERAEAQSRAASSCDRKLESRRALYGKVFVCRCCCCCWYT